MQTEQKLLRVTVHYNKIGGKKNYPSIKNSPYYLNYYLTYYLPYYLLLLTFKTGNLNRSNVFYVDKRLIDYFTIFYSSTSSKSLLVAAKHGDIERIIDCLRNLESSACK